MRLTKAIDEEKSRRKRVSTKKSMGEGKKKKHLKKKVSKKGSQLEMHEKELLFKKLIGGEVLRKMCRFTNKNGKG